MLATVTLNEEADTLGRRKHFSISNVTREYLTLQFVFFYRIQFHVDLASSECSVNRKLGNRCAPTLSSV